MVSFYCGACADVVKKPKSDQHVYRCPGAQFTCIDCNTTFSGNDYKSHTSCISEAEKYEKGLYKGDKKNKKDNNRKPSTPKQPSESNEQNKTSDNKQDQTPNTTTNQELEDNSQKKKKKIKRKQQEVNQLDEDSFKEGGKDITVKSTDDDNNKAQAMDTTMSNSPKKKRKKIKNENNDNKVEESKKDRHNDNTYSNKLQSVQLDEGNETPKNESNLINENKIGGKEGEKVIVIIKPTDNDDNKDQETVNTTMKREDDSPKKKRKKNKSGNNDNKVENKNDNDIMTYSNKSQSVQPDEANETPNNESNLNNSSNENKTGGKEGEKGIVVKPTDNDDNNDQETVITTMKREDDSPKKKRKKNKSGNNDNKVENKNDNDIMTHSNKSQSVQPDEAPKNESNLNNSSNENKIGEKEGEKDIAVKPTDQETTMKREDNSPKRKRRKNKIGNNDSKIERGKDNDNDIMTCSNKSQSVQTNEANETPKKENSSSENKVGEKEGEKGIAVKSTDQETVNTTMKQEDDSPNNMNDDVIMTHSNESQSVQTDEVNVTPKKNSNEENLNNSSSKKKKKKGKNNNLINSNDANDANDANGTKNDSIDPTMKVEDSDKKAMKRKSAAEPTFSEQIEPETPTKNKKQKINYHETIPAAVKKIFKKGNHEELNLKRLEEMVVPKLTIDSNLPASDLREKFLENIVLTMKDGNITLK